MQVMNAYGKVDMWLPSFLTSALYRVGVRDSVGAIPDSLRDGWYGDRFSVGGETSRTLPDRP